MLLGRGGNALYSAEKYNRRGGNRRPHLIRDSGRVACVTECLRDVLLLCSILDGYSRFPVHWDLREQNAANGSRYNALRFPYRCRNILMARLMSTKANALRTYSCGRCCAKTAPK